jgi:hypothetical protein
MDRNSELSLEKPQGLSRVQAQDMSNTLVNNHLKILQEILAENVLLNKACNVSNVDEKMDETGFNVSREPGGNTTQGDQSVHNLTSAEEVEHVSTVGACNTEGSILPPVAILKCTYKPQDWLSFGLRQDVKFV